MPELKPFKGIRYSSSAELKDLVCPPYDVISPDEQARLHERHPHNAVRLELARRDEEGEKYRNAADAFRDWMAQGVLTQDDSPSLYVYRQDFTSADGTRHRVAGVIGALELEPFGESSGVLPHEKTMAGPKQDRLELMRALRMNVSPIYAIYRGAGGLAPFIDGIENRPPEARVADAAGVLHRMWVITAPAEVQMLSDAIRPGPLVIADGHHRYETALAYHQELGDADGDHGTIMCFCVDADVEGLVVLPYNRAVRTAVSPADVTTRLRDSFGASPLEGTPHEAALRSSSADHPLVFVTENESFLVEISDADVVAAVGDRHPAWRALDVVALHQAVLPALLPEGVDDLTFSKDADTIHKLVSEGWSFGALLRAVSAAQIVDVAGSGERMPQKASYFWPKALTGLVFHSLGGELG